MDGPTIKDGVTQNGPKSPCCPSGTEMQESRSSSSIIIHFPKKSVPSQPDGTTNIDGENSGLDQLHEKQDDFLLQLMVAVNNLRQTSQLCDVMLQSGSTLIQAHRNILASSSPYFHAMLTGSMTESSAECVALHSIDGITLKQLVDFIYTGEITVTEENAQTLLTAANLSQLLDVRDMCCRFLKSRLHPKNCLGIWRFAEQLSCKQLSDASRKFAENHYSKVYRNNEEFLGLTAEELRRLVSNETLCASEDCIFESVRLWEEHDPSGRAKFAESIYKHVRFAHMSPEGLIQLSQSKTFLASRPVCRDLLLEAYTHQFLCLQGENPTASSNLKPRGKFTKNETTKIEGVDFEVDQLHEKREDFLLQLMLAVNELRETGQLCDVMLQSGSVLIQAHRNILASSSPYFRAMLTGALRESNSECVSIHSIDGATLKQLVDFIYTGEITITEENVQALLTAANLSQMNNVRDICCGFLESRLHPTNCLGIWKFSAEINCKQLSDTSRTFAEKHYGEIYKNNPEFCSLTAEELEKLISSDMLLVSEECIFESIRLWEEHEPAGRTRIANSLYKHVRFPHMSPKGLIRLSQSETFLASRPLCKDLLLEAYTHQFLVLKGKCPTELATIKPRGYVHEVLVVLGGESTSTRKRMMELFDFETASWTSLCLPTDTKSVPVSKSFDFGGVVVGHNLYILGGRVGNKTTNSVYIYDGYLNSWAYGPKMKQCRRNLGVTSLNQKVYAIGGTNEQGALNSAEVLDTSTGAWKSIASMPNTSSSPCVTTTNGKIFVVCKSRQDGYFVCYDPSNDMWTSIYSHSSTAYLRALCSLGNTLCSVRKSPYYNELLVQMYDLSLRSLDTEYQLVHEPFSPGHAASNGYLYLVHEEGSTESGRCVTKIDVVNKTFTELPNEMQVDRRDPVIGVLKVRRFSK